MQTLSEATDVLPAGRQLHLLAAPGGHFWISNTREPRDDYAGAQGKTAGSGPSQISDPQNHKQIKQSF